MEQTNYITPDIELWSNILSPDDYETVVRFVNDSHNGIVWNKMLILSGGPRTGKSTLVNAIIATFNTNQVSYPTASSINFNGNTKIYAVLENWSNSAMSDIKLILNREEMCSREPYQMVTGFIPSANIIGVANETPEAIYAHSPLLCDKAYVIRMTQTF